MEYEKDYSFSNMYFATEVRFDGIAKLAQNIVAIFTQSNRKPQTARA